LNLQFEGLNFGVTLLVGKPIHIFETGRKLVLGELRCEAHLTLPELAEEHFVLGLLERDLVVYALHQNLALRNEEHSPRLEVSGFFVFLLLRQAGCFELNNVVLQTVRSNFD